MKTAHHVSLSPRRKKKQPDLQHAPLGATLLDDNIGVIFRVWAPHADSVSVIGDFNHWNSAAHPLTRDELGNWNGFVPEAREGEEYQYAITRDGVEFQRVDPRALKVTNSIGNGVIYKAPPLPPPAERFDIPPLNRLVIYELHIGTFHTQKEDGPGTFQSAIKQLPYIKDLGVNCIELMPVAEFPGDFSWGYNPAHPFTVESRYGGPEGLRAFVDAAHSHGIAVILDVVYNHFGPGDLTLWQFDGWSENDLGGIYFYNDWQSATPWGHTRPDYGRGEVRAYIRDNALMWLDHYGIDGLRWDMTAYIRTYSAQPHNPSDDLKEGWTLCQWVNDEIHRAYPKCISIAEDMHSSTWLVKDTAGGGAGFNAQWDAAFVHPIRAILTTPNDADRDLDRVIAALRHSYENDVFRRVVYTESHDEIANGKARLSSEIDPGTTDSYPARKRCMLGAVLTLTAPGVPMLFQGQEFLEDGWFRDEVPLDWPKLGEHGGIHALFRDLVHLRLDQRNHSAGLCGQHLETNHVNHAQKILGYRRWSEGGPGDDVIVLINLSANAVENYDIGVPTDGVWLVRVNTDSTIYSGDFSDHPADPHPARPEPLDGYSHRITLGVAPYSAVVLSQDRV